MKNQVKPKLVLLLLNAVLLVFIGAMFAGVLFLQGPSHVLGNGVKKHSVTSLLPSIKTVFLIMMENKNWSSILGSPSAPYINDTLLPMASYTNQYYTPPHNHPSLPNYLWLEAGTNFGITKDGDPGLDHQSTTNHLTTLLSNAGYSWKVYAEGITGKTCPIKATGLYVPRHNPTVYFDDITGNNNLKWTYCIEHERPFTELATDLENNTVANYNFIVPNLCDDMHNSKCGKQGEVTNGDTWLSQNVPHILNSQAYQSGGALFIGWDEGNNDSDGPIGMIVLSPFAKGHGYSNSIYYTHSSTLLTIEEIFGLTPLLGDAANATDLSDLFVSPMPTPIPSPSPSPSPTPSPSPSPTGTT